MLTVPNVITLARLALLPLIVYSILVGRYDTAFYIFVAAAVGDLLDGLIARLFDQVSALGAVLDPVADKLTMIAVAIALASEGLLPLWLVMAILVRDIVILGGAIAYQFLIGPLEMAPTRLSKANTAVEFAVVALVMAQAANILGIPPALLQALFWAVLATVVASGVQYVWVWSGKARERRS
jgi:cardiolipin synthase